MKDFISFGRFVASTPTGTYAQRKNSGAVICSLNDRGTPTNWRGGRQEVKVVHYDPSKALTKPYHYMFQKVSDKAIGKKGRVLQDDVKGGGSKTDYWRRT